MDDALMSYGGSRPGVQLFQDGQMRCREVLRLFRGHSAYALDMDPLRHLAAAGTRNGLIHLMNLRPTKEDPKNSFSRTLIQGAPVSAVCWLECGRLAAADRAGRCLIWRPDDGVDKASALPTQGNCVASLLALSPQILAGLLDTGGLMLWNPSDATVLGRVPGPRPVKPVTLSRLQFWPARDALVYPAEGGWVAFYSLHQRGVRAFPAHQGALLATMVDNERLLTIGHDDGVCRAWESLDGEPTAKFRAPSGAMSAAVLPQSGSFLIVTDNGEAGVYTAGARSLHLEHCITGEAFRVTAGLPARARESLQRAARLEEASTLRERIQLAVGNGDVDSVEKQLRRLEQLGLKAAACALRAQLAARHGDLIGELTYRRELQESLGSDGESGGPSLQRYVELLETTWQLDTAARLRGRFGALNPAGTDWLDQAAAIMAGTDWVVSPEQPISLLVQAATVLNRPFVGQWRLSASKEVTIPIGQLTADAVAAKYEQIRFEEPRRRLPKASVRRMWHVLPRVLRRIELITFDEVREGGRARFVPALEVSRDTDQGRAAPMVLFVASMPGGCRRATDHNREVFRMVEAGTLRADSDHWPPSVRRTVGMALRRLHNELRAELTG